MGWRATALLRNSKEILTGEDFEINVPKARQHLDFQKLVDGPKKTTWFSTTADRLCHEAGNIIMLKHCVLHDGWGLGEKCFLVRYLCQPGFLVRPKVAPWDHWTIPIADLGNAALGVMASIRVTDTEMRPNMHFEPSFTESSLEQLDVVVCSDLDDWEVLVVQWISPLQLMCEDKKRVEDARIILTNKGMPEPPLVAAAKEAFFDIPGVELRQLCALGCGSQGD